MPDPNVGSYAVTIEYDGCCNGPDLFIGTREECIAYISRNWDRLNKHSRPEFADGPVIRDMDTERLISFAIP